MAGFHALHLPQWDTGDCLLHWIRYNLLPEDVCAGSMCGYIHFCCCLLKHLVLHHSHHIMADNCFAWWPCLVEKITCVHVCVLLLQTFSMTSLSLPCPWPGSCTALSPPVSSLTYTFIFKSSLLKRS